MVESNVNISPMAAGFDAVGATYSMCISIRCTGNNTIRTAWDLNTRKSVKTISAGRRGLKGARRGSPYAAEMVGRELGNIINQHESAIRVNASSGLALGQAIGISVRFAGHSVAIGSGLRGLRASLSRGFKVVSLIDTTPLPHNGCRARKPRRV